MVIKVLENSFAGSAVEEVTGGEWVANDWE